MTYEIIKRSGTLLEYWKYERSLLPKKAYIRREDPDRTGYRKHATRRPDNVRRSVSRFRRLVRSNLVPGDDATLLTLTMLQTLPLKASWPLLTQFFQRLRMESSTSIRYIAVPEFQKRGAVHFHALIWGLKKETIQQESTTRRIQHLWGRGFIDCINTDNSPKLAGYLSKYLSKSMLDVRLGGEKAYSASRNILRSMSVSSSSFTDEEKDLIGISDTPTHVRRFDTQWLGNCQYQCYILDEETKKI